jgi:hypothetical protein
MNYTLYYRKTNRHNWLDCGHCAGLEDIERQYTAARRGLDGWQFGILPGLENPVELRANVDSVIHYPINGWINDALAAEWWDSIDALASYLGDIIHDTQGLPELSHRTLDGKFYTELLGGLTEAAGIISARLAALGAPYEVYHSRV